MKCTSSFEWLRVAGFQLTGTEVVMVPSVRVPWSAKPGPVPGTRGTPWGTQPHADKAWYSMGAQN